MDKVKCPICSGDQVSIKLHTKNPADFGFEDFIGYTIFSCANCLAEFSIPRKPLEYTNIDKESKGYSRFTLNENRYGQIFHTLNCTSHWKDSPIVYNILAGALSLFGNQPTLLDFGAGSGYMTELARRLGYKVNALEACIEFGDFIQETISGVTVYRSLDEIKQKFDVIYAMHVLEHVPYPVEILQKLSSYLSEQGILILVVPNPDRSYYKFKEIGSELEDQIDWDGIPGDFPPHHLTRFRDQTMRVALSKGKFSQVAIGYALVNAWDLFYTGLGDQYFRFKDYSKDIIKMRTISLVEKNLNKMLYYLGLENLGNCLIALASNKVESTTLDDLIRNSREKVINQYVDNIGSQYNQFQETKTGKVEVTTKKLTDIENEIDRLDKELIEAQNEAENLKKDLNLILNSKSWKLIVPLRMMFYYFRILQKKISAKG